MRLPLKVKVPNAVRRVLPGVKEAPATKRRRWPLAAALAVAGLAAGTVVRMFRSRKSDVSEAPATEADES